LLNTAVLFVTSPIPLPSPFTFLTGGGFFFLLEAGCGLSLFAGVVVPCCPLFCAGFGGRLRLPPVPSFSGQIFQSGRFLTSSPLVISANPLRRTPPFVGAAFLSLGSRLPLFCVLVAGGPVHFFPYSRHHLVTLQRFFLISLFPPLRSTPESCQEAPCPFPTLALSFSLRTLFPARPESIFPAALLSAAHCSSEYFFPSRLRPPVSFRGVVQGNCAKFFSVPSCFSVNLATGSGLIFLLASHPPHLLFHPRKRPNVFPPVAGSTPPFIILYR